MYVHWACIHIAEHCLIHFLRVEFRPTGGFWWRREYRLSACKALWCPPNWGTIWVWCGGSQRNSAITTIIDARISAYMLVHVVQNIHGLNLQRQRMYQYIKCTVPVLKATRHYLMWISQLPGSYPVDQAATRIHIAGHSPTQHTSTTRLMRCIPSIPRSPSALQADTKTVSTINCD